ncbi:MAG: SH3 domain-containing protein [Planctomycetota bacterium]
MTRTTPLLLALLLLASPAMAQTAFKAEDVERAKAFWTANATGPSPMDCITTMNEAMRQLYNDRSMRLGSTVDLTMSALRKLRRANAPVVFGFLDEKGRPTSGVTQPKTLRNSLWDGIVAQCDGVQGWHLFGFSPLDGNHSVTLAVDLNDVASPQVYWADQWSTKGGWKLYPDKASLDGEVERLTSSWWASKLAEKGIKFRSDAKTYKLIPRPEEPQTEQTARLTRVPLLNVRSVPSTAGNAPVGSLRRADAQDLRVVGRQGQWVQLELPDGRKVWAHSYYLTLTTHKVDTTTRAGAATTVLGIGH